ncbi:hypothetical protein BDY19DRAFT_1060282 [Irpex rosettiformis]|uniref:Uncharacterized protein n=1 Tax=Irpex rosettiformis TaxID=378272 RepID=A0ACB8TR62_9APHY|nr:hypothetical protein BDY19DRAFT_1060282 [Irpex rosettiformis]
MTDTTNGPDDSEISSSLDLRSVDMPAPASESNGDTEAYILLLPNEILAIILVYLCAAWPLSLDYEVPWITIPGRGCFLKKHCNALLMRLGWMNVVHVCSRFRSIALGLPQLWAPIEVTEQSKPWLSEVLRRSGNERLSLSFSPIPSSEPSVKVKNISSILGQFCYLWRIEFARIHDPNGWLPFVRALLNSPAPRLVTLHIEQGLFEDDSKIVVLPKRLFDVSAPRLRHLTLTRCDFPWSSSSLCLPALTTLSITRPYIEPDEEYEVEYAWQPRNMADTLPRTRLGASDFSIRDVARCLRRLPFLETLVLENALPNQQSTLSDAEFPRIVLPNLRRLRIKQRRLRLSSSLLDLLDTPQLRFFEFNCMTIARPAGPDLQAHYTSLARFLSCFIENFSSPITTLSVGFHNSRIEVGANLHGAPESLDRTPCQHGIEAAFGPSFLKITLEMATFPNTFEFFPIRHAIVEPILMALPLDRLGELRIFDEILPDKERLEWIRELDFSLWYRIFHLCANARKVCAEGMALTPLVPLLACRNDSSWKFTTPPPEPRTPAFPKLEHLSLLMTYLPVSDDYAILCLTHGHPQLEVGGGGPATAYLEVVWECLFSRLESLPMLKILRLRLDREDSTWHDSAGVDQFDEKFAQVAEEVEELKYERWRYLSKQHRDLLCVIENNQRLHQ